MNLFNTPALPRLTIAQRVIDKIVANALIYETETGESLVGLASPRTDGPGEPDLFVLDTIPPEDAIRGDVMFIQGDEYQGMVFNWWHDNWKRFRDERVKQWGKRWNARWDESLAHLGNWHKHPGTLTTPSGGDTDTALNDLADPHAGSPQVLVMLATVWDSGEPADDGALLVEVRPDEHTELFGPFFRKLDDRAFEEGALLIKVDAHTLVRVDCWYMSRNVRRFTRLYPVVVPNAELPALAPIGWHIANADRVRDELQALERKGYSLNTREYNTDGAAPLEVCISAARSDSRHVLILVTDADYPARRPAVRITPMSAIKEMPQGGDIFDHIWRLSEPLPAEAYPAWRWTSDRTLLDLVRDVEVNLKEHSKS